MKTLKLFKLLLKKNFKKQIYSRRQWLLSILMPVFFTLILVGARFSYVSSLEKEIQHYEPIDFGIWWEDLMSLIKRRLIVIQWAQPNFLHNTFIPELVIGFAPNNSEGYNNIMELALSDLSDVTLKSYKNCDDLANNMFVHHFLMSICFHENKGKGKKNLEMYPLVLNFSILVPSEFRIYDDSYVGASWDTSFNYDRFHKAEERANQGPDGGRPGYVREGVISVQYFISMAYITLASNASDIPGVFLKRFDVIEDMHDKFGEGVQISIALLYLMGFMYPVATLSEIIVYEDELKQRYLLNTNGIGYVMQLLAWFVNGLLPFFVSSVFCVFILEVPWNGSISVLVHCPWYLALIFFFSYSVAAVAFSILMAIICRTTKNVLALIPLTWIIGFLPFMAKADEYNERQHLISIKSVSRVLLLNVTLGAGIKRLIAFERFVSKLTIIEYLQDTISNDDYSILYFIGYFYVQAALYLLLAIIINNTLMSTLIRRCMNIITQRKQKPLPNESKDFKKQNFEMDDGQRKVVVEFDNVSLKYSKLWVVKNFSFKLHENEVICLHGQNASGKTSIMKMVCGLLQPTKGTITIEGYNIWKNARKGFKNVSFSMKNIGVFKEFTVEEIILYFSAIRGLTKVQAREDLIKYLRMLKIENLRNTRTAHLTMGQRQVLGILCAFAGRNKIVLLDKPFEGVDAYSTELLCRFLEHERAGRSILLTLSQSKIAEMIGDQIAVIEDGELLCKGSMSFLSEAYKDGYRLICQLGERCSLEELTEFLKKHVPTIEKETDYACKAIYRIDYKYAKQLETLLNELTKHKESLYLNKFSIIDCSLEHLIYNMYAHNREQRQQQYYDEDVFRDVTYELEHVDGLIDKHKHYQGARLFLSHIWIVLHKNYLLDLRSPLLPLVKILMPTFLAILIFSLPHSISERENQLPERIFSLDNYDSTVTFYDIYTTTGVSHNVSTTFENRWPKDKHFVIKVDNKTIMEYMRNKTYKEDFLDNYHFPVAFTFDEKFIVAWFNNYIMHSAPLSINIVVDAIAGTLVDPKSRIYSSLRPLPFSTTHYVDMTRGTFKLDNIFAIAMTFCYCFVWSLYLLNLTMSNINRHNKIESIAGLQMGRLALSTLIYEFIKITFSFVPLNSIVMLFKFRQLMQLNVYFIFVLIMLVTALCMLAYNILISKLLPDINAGYVLVLMFHSFGIVCFLMLFEIDQYRRPGEDSTMPNLNFLPYYGLASMFVHIFVYSDLSSNCADKETNETTILLEKCVAIPNCCDLMDINFISDLTPMVILTCLSWISYILWKRFFSSKKMHMRREVSYDITMNSYYDQYLRHFVYLDNRDKSWMQEKQRVRTLERGRLLLKPLHCENVCVHLSNTIILNRLNFMIERYQAFAVLGKNGTGKSTLIETILGEHQLSDGFININYSENSTDPQKIRKRLGYCPQQSVPEDDLSIIETIEFVLLVRGMPRRAVTNIAVTICKVFDVYRFRYHAIRTCSRGIVKRIDIALAMIGYPSLILLDEPFSALDDSGQRLIFHVIGQICARGQAVLINSVDPDVCELVNRVALLKDCSFAAIGEVDQQLLQGYYEYYTVVIVRFRLEFLKDSRYSVNYEQMLADKRLRWQQVIRLKMAKFMEEQFPQAIVKRITFNVVTCWFSLAQCSFAEIMNILHKHADCFYSFSITPINLSTLFKDYAARPDRQKEVMKAEL